MCSVCLACFCRKISRFHTVPVKRRGCMGFSQAPQAQRRRRARQARCVLRTRPSIRSPRVRNSHIRPRMPGAGRSQLYPHLRSAEGRIAPRGSRARFLWKFPDVAPKIPRRLDAAHLRRNSGDSLRGYARGCPTLHARRGTAHPPREAAFRRARERASPRG